MNSRQRTWLLVAASVQLSLAVTAWVNLAKRPAAEVKGPKALWAAIIAVNFIGPLSYFAFGRRRAS
ncbi:PLDc N-terminal domain-containing protein [Agromyces sp. Soil535]|uniref:PLDc N-terminal domain-containing protein n=1 Tax=Agromyces sp. Soil535 TaxID=1736390 RepID=UPI000ACD08D2|nr:PLDc N-terminal domain-containing protein [Agromyces sp. Soil535]